MSTGYVRPAGAWDSAGVSPYGRADSACLYSSNSAEVEPILSVFKDSGRIQMSHHKKTSHLRVVLMSLILAAGIACYVSWQDHAIVATDTIEMKAAQSAGQ